MIPVLPCTCQDGTEPTNDTSFWGGLSRHVLWQGDSEGQLLPQGRPWRAVLHRRRRVLHAPVRPRLGGPLADTRLPQHGRALRLRGRHVLLLRHRRGRSRRRRQSHQYVTSIVH
jgi:hypothetical protein